MAQPRGGKVRSTPPQNLPMNRNSQLYTPTPSSRSGSLMSRLLRSAARSGLSSVRQSAAERLRESRRRRSNRTLPAAAAGRGYVSRFTGYERTTGNGRGAVLNKTNKRSKVMNQKKKKLKVSDKFRKSVLQVTKPIGLRGVQTEVNTGFLLHPATFDNQQQHYYHLNIGPGGQAFNPVHFQDAASVLFNSKTIGGTKSIGQANNFNMTTLKFFVKNSYVKTTFRNNSQRTITLKVTTCKPKSAASFAGNDPLSQWDAALVKDQTQGGGTIPGQNVTAVGRSFINLNPMMLPTFKHYWDQEETKFELQPGQSQSWFLQGPKDWEFDGNKYYNGGTFVDLQKFTRFVYCTTIMDLVGDITGVAGRLKDPVNVGDTFQGNGIIYENTYHYDIKMPEQAGFVFPLGPASPFGLSQALNQRKGFTYAFKNYSGAQAGAVNRVDDENPAVNTATPV